ncbi:helix-turn-helix domain-containing protein [Streptomyces sp. NPDC058953]|uniref:helix-turn-helix domain-containing protein n=1 Tax=unclassified Streptomyces TaxID=2593676 RepID=UPI0036960976
MADTEPDPTRAPEAELGTAALRVLAHPARIHLLGLLRREGPSTATRIGEAMGITPGAASYHLRRLAAGGLIGEDSGRGVGRERWWRALHGRSLYDPAAATGEQRDAGLAYTRAVAVAATERLRAATEEIPYLPVPWAEVSTFADSELRLAPDDAARLRDELLGVIARYRRDTATAESGPVVVQLQIFPAPGTATGSPDPR